MRSTHYARSDIRLFCTIITLSVPEFGAELHGVSHVILRDWRFWLPHNIAPGLCPGTDPRRSHRSITRKPRCIGASAAQGRPPARQTARAEVAPAETSRVPYQAYLAADCLSGGNFCKFISEVVPSRQRLEIHRLACQGWTNSNTTPPWFVAIANLTTDPGAFVQRIDFLETRDTPANGGSVWAISEQVLIFIPAAHKLRMDVNSGPTEIGSYGCTLSGYLVTF